MYRTTSPLNTMVWCTTVHRKKNHFTCIILSKIVFYPDQFSDEMVDCRDTKLRSVRLATQLSSCICLIGLRRHLPSHHMLFMLARLSAGTEQIKCSGPRSRLLAQLMGVSTFTHTHTLTHSCICMYAVLHVI